MAANEGEPTPVVGNVYEFQSDYPNHLTVNEKQAEAAVERLKKRHLDVIKMKENLGKNLEEYDQNQITTLIEQLRAEIADPEAMIERDKELHQAAVQKLEDVERRERADEGGDETPNKALEIERNRLELLIAVYANRLDIAEKMNVIIKTLESKLE